MNLGIVGRSSAFFHWKKKKKETKKMRCAWLAQLEGHATPDIGVVSLSPMLGMKVT